MLEIKEAQDAIWHYKIFHEVSGDLATLLDKLDETLSIADGEIEALICERSEVLETLEELYNK